VARKIRKADVVSAFGTVPSEVLFNVFRAKRRRRTGRASSTAGDDKDAKDVARVGFVMSVLNPSTPDHLRIARYLEPFTLAMGQLAYDTDEGPQIAYRYRALREVEQA